MALGLALQAHAFLDQGLEDLAAFGLGLGEGAQAGQPDLLGRVLDRTGQLAVEQAGGLRDRLLLGDFCSFLTMAVSWGLCSCAGRRMAPAMLHYRRSSPAGHRAA
jgi:hypothetical protein